MTDLHQRGYFNGAVVVSREGQTLYAGGFGYCDVGAGIPFTPDTLSDGGSIAKTLTAAAVLVLREDGRLDIDDAVQGYLPEFPYPEITIRHLLTHSSGGLPDYEYFEPFFEEDQVQTTARHLGILRDQRPALRFQPGERFEYNNLDSDLAALIIERVTGTTCGEFLQERVFTPLSRPPPLCALHASQIGPGSGHCAIEASLDRSRFMTS